MRKYHHQQANLDNSDQIIGFILGENKIYLQIGNAYIQFDIKIRKDDITNFITEAKKLVISALAYRFKEAMLSTTGGSDLERSRFVGQISSTMKYLAFINLLKVILIKLVQKKYLLTLMK